jgi:hypothetical protein
MQPVETIYTPAIEALPAGPERDAVHETFNEIVDRIDEVTATAEIGEALAATPFQKNTGISDRPKAYR